jgi:hypothetical protein
MRAALIGIILTGLLSGCTIPSLSTPAAPPASGTVLFKDDFSSPLSGWDRTQYDQGIMDYDGGSYRILVNARQANFWSTPHKDFSDVRLEVDAGKLGGPDENRLGLICRSNGLSYYFFIITSDGYFAIGLFQDGKAALLGQSEMQRSSKITTGTAVNHLRFDCNGARLQGYVNGSAVADVSDTTLAHGDVGLLAGTFEQPGADIVFGNFIVIQP